MTDIQRVDFQLTDGMARGCVYETDDIQIMRIRLLKGEAVPHHNSNANVLLMPILGTVRLKTEDRDEVVSVGQALKVPYNIPMDVSNAGDDMAVILVLKTPHPKSFK